MTDNLTAHLEHDAVKAANRAFAEHLARCDQCRVAPGPPPPGCPPEQRYLYACYRGLALHERSVVAAHEALRDADPKAFEPEPHRDG